MIVDVHTYLWDRPQQLGAGAAELLRTDAAAPWERQDASTVAYDRAMSVVSHAIILGFESRYLGASIPHRQVADHAKRRPGAYFGFAGIDPLAPGYLDSVREAVNLGLVGIVTSPAAQNCHPTHSRAMKLYELCEQLGLPIMVTAGLQMDAAAVMEFARPELLDAVGREFPRLHVVLAQVGYPWVDATLVLLGKHRHFHADVSGLSRRPWQLAQMIAGAMDLHVTDRLLLGSGFPFSTPEQVIQALYTLPQETRGMPSAAVPRSVVRQIVERNAMACIGLGEHVADSDDRPHEAAPDATDTPNTPNTPNTPGTPGTPGTPDSVTPPPVGAHGHATDPSIPPA